VVPIAGFPEKSWYVGFSGYSGGGDFSGFSSDAKVDLQDSTRLVRLTASVDAFVGFSGFSGNYPNYSGIAYASQNDHYLPSGMPTEFQVKGGERIMVTSKTSGIGTLYGSELSI
jgi:hypothetical protein